MPNKVYETCQLEKQHQYYYTEMVSCILQCYTIKDGNVISVSNLTHMLQ